MILRVAIDSLKNLSKIKSDKILEYIISNLEEYYGDEFIEYMDVDIEKLSIDSIEMVVLHVT